MKTYKIDIAKAYTQRDWRGLPAHRFHARIELREGVNEETALAELERLKAVYPWPEYHITLSRYKQIHRYETIASNADEGFLKAHGWPA